MDALQVYWCTDINNHWAQLLYFKFGCNAGIFVYRRLPGSY